MDIPFLSHFKDSIIQTFDDVKDRKNAELTRFWKAENAPEETLRALNKQGAGIFFSPNQFASGRRLQSECSGITAWYMENDTLSKDEQFKNVVSCPLAPSFIVESKNSLHLYWLAADASFEKFQTIEQGLCEYFQGDPAVKSIERVLRVPGFNHCKDPETPFEIGIIEQNPELVYTQEEMLAAFPAKEKDSFTDPKYDIKEYLGGVGEMRNETASSLFGHLFSIKQADERMIWEIGLLWNQKNNPPLPEKELFSVFSSIKKRQDKRENLLKKENDERFEPVIASDCEDVLKMKLETPLTPFTWGSAFLDITFPPIEPGHHIVLFGQSGSGKTQFAMSMAKANASVPEVGKVLFLSLEMSSEQLLRNYILKKEGVSKAQYMRGDIPEDITRHLTDLENIEFIGAESGACTVGDIENIIEKHKYSLVFVDNLNKIDGKGDTELDTTQFVSSELLALTRKYKVPFVIIHHANKPTVLSKTDRQTRLVYRGAAGIRGSQKVTDDADVVLEIVRPLPEYLEYEKELVESEAVGEEHTSTVAGLWVYKDRDWGIREKVEMFYHQGCYYTLDEYETIIQ